MDERGRQKPFDRVDADEEPPERGTEVRAHESRPGRLVFTEEGNTDGWIATDLAVEPDR